MIKKQNIVVLALTLITSLLFTGCDWVKSDREGCPNGYWLQLEYSYNLLDVDAASQLEDVIILAYDSTGNFVKRLVSTKAERMLNDGKIELKGFEQGIYNFILWGGVSDNDDLYMQHEFGTLNINNLQAGLRYPENIQNKNFTDVYYGCLKNVKLNGGPEVNTVQMIKDTNKLVCLVRSNGSESFSADNFTMEVKAPNGTMDAWNTPLTQNIITYQPYSQTTVKICEQADQDSVSVARYGLQTLRLMQNDNSRLILKLKNMEKVIFDIPLTTYIGKISALYELYGQPLSEQEYLDRQDFHTFIFYLTKEEQGDYELVQMRVNNWIVRLNDNVDLKD